MNAPPQWALCAFCGQDRKAYNSSLGAFLGPLDDGNRSGVGVYVHRDCALWSSEVYHNSDGTKLRKVGQAIRRGRQIRCRYCGERGATLGCRLDRCNTSYHLPCARASGCAFFNDRYLIACPRHVAEFKHELAADGQGQEHGQRQGGQGSSLRRAFFGGLAQGPGEKLDGGCSVPNIDAYAGRHSHGAADRNRGRVEPAGHRDRREDGNGPPSKRRKIDFGSAARHIAVAHAALASARCAAAAAAAVAEVDDDEAFFAAKERRRHAKDTTKLSPVMLGGVTAAGGNGERDGGRGLYSRGFECVGGLQAVIQSLREMVLLPLLYPGLMETLGMTGAVPPRGILLHGQPGTGKTLVVRALAGEVARRSPVPVALFARGGADVLGKYHGDAERTLRLLFEEAHRRAPAIIFLDELDALAPRRSVSAGGADQIYASVVTTLLALMDGVADRGQVVVIGATNRPDNLDPALRRPGRFDREVAVGLPSREDRAAVLRVHTASWKPPPPDHLINRVADLTDGFAGADLASLCSSAVMATLRRVGTSATAPVPRHARADVVEMLLRCRERQQRAEGQRKQAQPLLVHQNHDDGKGCVPAKAFAMAKLGKGEISDNGGKRDITQAGAAPAPPEKALPAAVASGSLINAASDATRLLLHGKRSDMDAADHVNDDYKGDRKRDAAIFGGEAEPRRLLAAVAEATPIDAPPSEAVGAAKQAGYVYEEAGHQPPALGNAEGGGGRAADMQRRPRSFASVLRGYGSMFDRTASPAQRSQATQATNTAATETNTQTPAALAAVAAVRPVSTISGATVSHAALLTNSAYEKSYVVDTAINGQPPGTPTMTLTGHRIVRQVLSCSTGQCTAGTAGQEATAPAERVAVSDTDVETGVTVPVSPEGVHGVATDAAADVQGLLEQSGILLHRQHVQQVVVENAEAGDEHGNSAAPLSAGMGDADGGGEGMAGKKYAGIPDGVPGDGGEESALQVGKDDTQAMVNVSSSENGLEGQEDATKAEDWLAGVRIEEADWEAALAAAPKPCSRRDATAVVSAAGPPPPPPSYTAALVAPTAAEAILRLVTAGIAVPEPIAAIAAMVVGSAERQADITAPISATAQTSSVEGDSLTSIMAFLRLLISSGAIEGPPSAVQVCSDDGSGSGLGAAAVGDRGPVATAWDGPAAAESFSSAAADNKHVASGGMLRLQVPSARGKMAGPQPQSAAVCHLLLCGPGNTGREAVAALLLRLLDAAHTTRSQNSLEPEAQRHHPSRDPQPSGNWLSSSAVVHTISLPGIVLRSGGGDGLQDAAAGVASLVSEALSPAHGSRRQLQVLYLPAIDTWALEQRVQVDLDLAVDKEAKGLADEMDIAETDIGGAAAVGREGQQHGLLSSGGLVKGKQRRQEPECVELSDEDDDGLDSHVESTEEAEMEALPCNSRTYVSPAWSVFMQQVSVADPGIRSPFLGMGGGGGLLVLATCALPPDQLPSEILDFFGGERSAVQPQSNVVTAAETTAANAWAAREPRNVGLPELYGLSTQHPLPASCHIVKLMPPPAAAVEAAADAAEAAVLPIALQALKSCVLQTLHYAATFETAQVKLSHRSVTAAATIGAADGAATGPERASVGAYASSGSHGPHRLPSVAEAIDTAPSWCVETERGDDDAARATEPAAGTWRMGHREAFALKENLGMNNAELERGRWLLLQVKTAIRGIASSMLRKGSGCHLARASVGRPPRGNDAEGSSGRALLREGEAVKEMDRVQGPLGCHRDNVDMERHFGNVGRGASRGRMAEVISLIDVAQRAVEGRINTLEHLQLEVQSAAALIRAIRISPAARSQQLNQTQQPEFRHTRHCPSAAGARLLHQEGPSSSSSGVGYSRAAAAASMWEDAVVAACEAASRALQLDDPENRRLMRAALEHYQQRGGAGGSTITASTAAKCSAAAGAGNRDTRGLPDLRIPCNATAEATEEGKDVLLKRTRIWESEPDLQGTSTEGQLPKRLGADTAVPSHSALSGAASIAAARTGTAAAVADILERQAATLVSKVEARLEEGWCGLRRLLISRDADDVGTGISAGEIGGESNVSGIDDKALTQPSVKERAVVLGPTGLHGDGGEVEGGVALLFDERVRQVARRLLAASERACTIGDGEVEFERHGAAAAYESWMRCVVARAIARDENANAGAEVLDLVEAAAGQLASILRASAE